MGRTFEIYQTGDPCNRYGWNVREHEGDGSNTVWFRGDISPIQGRENAIRKLRRMYPGCKVKVNRNG